MFSAGSIWKIHVVLAMIALISLPAAELAEVQRHALSRRKKADKPPLMVGVPVENIRCGDSWKAAPIPDSPKLQGDQIACRGYDGVGYFCPSNTCKYGSLKTDDVPHGYSLSDWRFEKCTRYPNPKEIDPTTRNPPLPFEVKKLYPISIWAHNKAGYMVVRGWDEEKTPPDQTTRNYICKWKNFKDINNQRPACRRCIRGDFKEDDEPKIILQK
ncbi:hypothetical protein PTTG_28536 [Puccinia triticina 1-1 BBBD Race 1]|uniref:Secreted protein n=1 Tax=Puccinia triticina (isolate 1-1 / race 1 (BBBD)) TaxID=630390 RepID=A0A180GB51_PUCT1|nr:hypothetical protein PTTG_28536 [Puccinia triticina 1-1 BBBD Race 1]WAR58939.1 hypothetical protein PtB15_10B279 [Puccinia triticina]